MKIVWPVLLVVLRTLYLGYSLWCLLFPVALLAALWVLVQEPLLLAPAWRLGLDALLAASGVLALVLLWQVYARREPDDPSPFQSALLAWIGGLRAYWNTQPGDRAALGLPSGFLVENPPGYRLVGRDMAAILACIQPGDILLRGYVGYLDGWLIRKASVCSEQGFRPGWFTHAALYVGSLDPSDQAWVPAAYQCTPRYFQTGPQMVVHAMARGVHTQDLLSFCRCDTLAILRVPPGIGGPALVQAARQSALEKIGSSYDFDLSDTQSYHRFSCSELVYYCLRSVHTALQMQPLPHALFPFAPLLTRPALLRRVTIVPDDFYALVAQGHMECVWEDASSARAHANAPGCPPAP